jgi:hypothetical protein
LVLWKNEIRLTGPRQTWEKWGEKKPKSVKSEMEKWDNNKQQGNHQKPL